MGTGVRRGKKKIMQLISDNYRKLNTQLHQDNHYYGESGIKYAFAVFNICKEFKTTDVLDYGCGKSTLAHNLPFKISQYDPAIKKFAIEPKPANIVVCTDVLEHIEPELLDNVLDNLKTLTKKIILLTVACGPAKKSLPDGRNAHLIQRPYGWWLMRLLERFDILKFTAMDAGTTPNYEFLFIGRAK